MDAGPAVSVFLVNGIRLTGRIAAFDHYVVQLKDGSGMQMIYKHAISTVVPQDAKPAREGDAAAVITLKPKKAYSKPQE